MSLLEDKFKKYHKENPHVYELFKKFAGVAIEKGHDKIASKLIFERIRWEVSIETVGDKFKLNNNYTAYYARMFMKDYPEHTGIFETRKTK